MKPSERVKRTRASIVGVREQLVDKEVCRVTALRTQHAQGVNRGGVVQVVVEPTLKRSSRIFFKLVVIVCLRGRHDRMIGVRGALPVRASYPRAFSGTCP